MSKKMLVAAAALMVTRDAMTILPATVPAHEVEVMKAVHGEENVRELDAKAEAVEVDVEVEAERLEAKYGPGPLEKAYGANYKGKIAKACAEAAVNPASDDSAGAGAGAGGPPALDAMTKAQLLAEAEKRGVKADATMNKAQIVEAIETANLG